MAEQNQEKIKVKILDIRDVPSTEPDRLGKLDRLVTYQVGPGQVYMIRIPLEEFSEERLKEEIKKDLEERKRWVGKEIEI